MNGTLRENSRGTRCDINGDESGTILGEETSTERGIKREVNLGGARMSMRCVHSARTQEANSCVLDQNKGVETSMSDLLIATPFPMTAGKFSEEAATVCPPAPVVTPDGGAKKLNRYCSTTKISKFEIFHILY